jgi:hypothetical protein
MISRICKRLVALRNSRLPRGLDRADASSSRWSDDAEAMFAFVQAQSAALPGHGSTLACARLEQRMSELAKICSNPNQAVGGVFR